MSDRRIREQHRRKFQELINPENQNVSEAIPLAAEAATIFPAVTEAKATISPVVEAKATIFPRRQ